MLFNEEVYNFMQFCLLIFRCSIRFLQKKKLSSQLKIYLNKEYLLHKQKLMYP